MKYQDALEARCKKRVTKERLDFFAPAYRRQVLAPLREEKKEELAQSRKVGKAQSREAPAILRDRPQSAAAESHTDLTTISLWLAYQAGGRGKIFN